MNYLSIKETGAPVASVRVECLRILADLQARRAEWLELTLSAPAALRPAYVEAAWIKGLCKGELRVLMAYQNDRLVAVWPLYASRNAGSTIIRHIGNGGREEYAGPFLAADVQPEPVLAALWTAVRSEGDVLELYNLRDGSPAHRFFSETQARARQAGSIVGPLVRTGSVPWADFVAGKSKNFRDDLKGQRKKLAAKGQVTFRRIPASDAIEHARWCVEMKRLWLDDEGIKDSWLRSDALIAFYAEMMDREAGVEGFALELDGKTIAGVICLIGGGVCEYYLTVYDKDWHGYSVGSLLMIDELARWCTDHGLDLDYRFPTYGYKERCANDQRTFHTIALALTGRGVLVLAGRRALVLQKRLRSGVKKLAKFAIGRLRPSPKPRRAHGQGHT